MQELKLFKKLLKDGYMDLSTLLDSKDISNDLIIRLACVNTTLDRVYELIGMIEDGKITDIRE